MNDICLPGLPPPKPAESFNGYLLRLSELNGYDNLALLHRIAGYVGMPLAFRPENIEPISQLISLSKDKILRMSYERGSTIAERKKLSFLGSDVFHYLVDVKHPKICPACVRQSRYVHALWDLTPVVACPIHGTMLLDHCPRCNRTLSWRRRGLLTCNCGASLRTAATPRARAMLCALMTIMAASAGLGAPPKRLPSNMPRDLLKMPLGELLHCVAWFGWWNSGHARESVRLLRALRPAERVPIIEASLPVLTNWPAGLESFLERMRGEAPRSSVNPVVLEFGKLYAFLFYGPTPPGREFIREHALRWLRATPEGSRLAKWAAKPTRPKVRTPEKVEFQRCKAIGKQLGLGPRAVRRTVLGGGLTLPVGSLRISSAKLARLRDRSEDLMLYRDAAQLLGISQKLLRALLRDHAIPSDNAICTNARRRYGSIHRSDLERFLSSIGRVARDRIRMPNRKFIMSLSDAFQTETSHFFTRNGLLDAVIEGRIRCYGDGSPGALGRLFVDIRDVKRSAIQALKGTGSDLIPLADAAKRFSVCNDTIRKLARSGRVRGHLINAGARKYWLVSLSDLQQIRQTTVAPSQEP